MTGNIPWGREWGCFFVGFFGFVHEGGGGVKDGMRYLGTLFKRGFLWEHDGIEL